MTPVSGTVDDVGQVSADVPRHVRAGLAAAIAGSGILLASLMFCAADAASFNESFYAGITIMLGLVSIAALLSARLSPVGFGMGLVALVLGAVACVKILAVDYLGGFS